MHTHTLKKLLFIINIGSIINMNVGIDKKIIIINASDLGYLN